MPGSDLHQEWELLLQQLHHIDRPLLVQHPLVLTDPRGYGIPEGAVSVLGLAILSVLNCVVHRL